MSRPHLTVLSWCLSALLALLLLEALLGGGSAHYGLTTWIEVDQGSRDVGHPYPDSRSIFDQQESNSRRGCGTAARIRRVEVKGLPQPDAADVQKNYKASLARGEKLLKLLSEEVGPVSKFTQHSDLERYGWEEAKPPKVNFGPAWSGVLKDWGSRKIRRNGTYEITRARSLSLT